MRHRSHAGGFRGRGERTPPIVGDYLPHERTADAGAGNLSCRSTAPEPIENKGELLFRNSRAGVGELEPRAVMLSRQRDGHGVAQLRVMQRQLVAGDLREVVRLLLDGRPGGFDRGAFGEVSHHPSKPERLVVQRDEPLRCGRHKSVTELSQPAWSAASGVRNSWATSAVRLRRSRSERTTSSAIPLNAVASSPISGGARSRPRLSVASSERQCGLRHCSEGTDKESRDEPARRENNDESYDRGDEGPRPSDIEHPRCGAHRKRRSHRSDSGTVNDDQLRDCSADGTRAGPARTRPRAGIGGEHHASRVEYEIRADVESPSETAPVRSAPAQPRPRDSQRLPPWRPRRRSADGQHSG